MGLRNVRAAHVLGLRASLVALLVAAAGHWQQRRVSSALHREAGWQ